MVLLAKTTYVWITLEPHNPASYSTRWRAVREEVVFCQDLMKDGTKWKWTEECTSHLVLIYEVRSARCTVLIVWVLSTSLIWSYFSNLCSFLMLIGHLVFPIVMDDNSSCVCYNKSKIPAVIPVITGVLNTLLVFPRLPIRFSRTLAYFPTANSSV